METSSRRRRLNLILLPFIPISIIFGLLHFHPLLVLFLTILAIIPITTYIARATQQLSMRTTTVAGSLLNATFGNAVEFMIAILAIRAGLIELVKASIIGSIILNILLLIGLSIFLGGLKFREQTFNKDSIGVASTMLLIAVVGLSLPTLYSLITGNLPVVMNYAVSITLGVTYLLSLIFVLFTHRHLFEAKRAVDEELIWSTKTSIIILLVFIMLAAVESEILVGIVRPVVQLTGIHEIFFGMIIVAFVTNIPEHLAAISYGLRNNITFSLEIGMNSAIQIALFVAPILVFVNPLIGGDMTLAFSPFQIAALILTVMIINYIGSDGICNWLEGVQLIAVYIIIAIAFYFI